MYFREAAPYRVAVLPLLDRRPPLEHQGQRPSIMFLLVWNRRIGDYYTSDLAFGGQVGEQLAKQLAAYLKTANVFTQVDYMSLPVQEGETVSPSSLQSLDQGQRPDYLLGGELHHFFGSQHQHFSMFLLPLYFINAWGWQDNKGLPWGQTVIRASLYDGRNGEIVWQNRIEASETLPQETNSMTEAAMKSFTAAAGQLATELRQLQLESLRTPSSR